MSKLTDLATANSRSRLPRLSNGAVHWRFLARGKALGYRPHEGENGSGSWVARCLVAGSKRYRKTTLGTADDARRPADGERIFSFEEASRAALEWCDDQERVEKGLEPRDRAPYTVERAMRDYLEWVRAHRKAPQQVEQVMNCHILPGLGEIEVEHLTTQKIRRWHQAIADSPPRLRSADRDSPNLGELLTPEDRRKRKNTANRVLAVLKAALNMAFREGRVDRDHAWRRVKPFRAVDQPKVRYLETDEALALLEACEPDFRDLVRGALLTGCRYGELTRLRVCDFQRTPMPIIRLQQTKSGRGRYVYLNDQGAGFFENLCNGRADSEALFLRSSGDPWGRAHQIRPMKEASKQAEIDPPATFHELRHTYASHYLMNGGDLPGLSQQLGHADTRMTTRHYAHLADHWRAEQARLHVPSFTATKVDGGSVPPPGQDSSVTLEIDSKIN